MINFTFSKIRDTINNDTFLCATNRGAFIFNKIVSFEHNSQTGLTISYIYDQKQFSFVSRGYVTQEDIDIFMKLIKMEYIFSF